MCLWKFKYKIRDIFKTAIRFSKHILTGSLHEGSCILTYIINQANQRKICCITKGTIKLLQFSCSWYKLMQDTHWGNQKSSNPRRNKITKSHSKLAKGKAWIKKKSFQTLVRLDVFGQYLTTLNKEKVLFFFSCRCNEKDKKLLLKVKVEFQGMNKSLYYYFF